VIDLQAAAPFCTQLTCNCTRFSSVYTGFCEMGGVRAGFFSHKDAANTEDRPVGTACQAVRFVWNGSRVSRPNRGLEVYR